MTTHLTFFDRHPVRAEWPLLFGVASVGLFLVFGKAWLADRFNPVWEGFLFL